MAPSVRLTRRFLLWFAITSLTIPVSLHVAEAFSPDLDPKAAVSGALFDGDFVASSIDDDSDSAADTDVDSDTDFFTDADSDTESDTDSRLDTDVDADKDADIDVLDTDIDADKDTDIDTVKEAGSDPDAVPDTTNENPDKDADSDTEAVPDIAPPASPFRPLADVEVLPVELEVELTGDRPGGGVGPLRAVQGQEPSAP